MSRVVVKGEGGVGIKGGFASSKTCVCLVCAGLSRLVAAFGKEVLHADGTLNRAKMGKLIFGDEGMCLRERDCSGGRGVLSRGLSKHVQPAAAPPHFALVFRQNNDTKTLRWLLNAPGLRKKLNGALGLPIFIEILRQLAAHWARGRTLVFLDAPTLYETKRLVPLCAKVVVVAVDGDAQASLSSRPTPPCPAAPLAPSPPKLRWLLDCPLAMLPRASRRAACSPDEARQLERERSAAENRGAASSWSGWACTLRLSFINATKLTKLIMLLSSSLRLYYTKSVTHCVDLAGVMTPFASPNICLAPNARTARDVKKSAITVNKKEGI